jgi:hypothetical protein
MRKIGAATQWKRGTTGNRHGRRFEKQLRVALMMEIARDPTALHRIARKLIELAAAGNWQAAKIIFDRVDGALDMGSPSRPDST